VLILFADIVVVAYVYYMVIHNYGNLYEKWNIFVARPHLWLQLGTVKPEIMLCETVLNLSTLKTNGSRNYESLCICIYTYLSGDNFNKRNYL